MGRFGEDGVTAFVEYCIVLPRFHGWNHHLTTLAQQASQVLDQGQCL